MATPSSRGRSARRSCSSRSTWRPATAGFRSSTFDDNEIKNLAVCVAGCRAEHLLDAYALRKTKIGDFRLMRGLLARLPETERRAARAAGYQLC
jgi:hypothetical protein